MTFATQIYYIFVALQWKSNYFHTILGRKSPCKVFLNEVRATCDQLQPTASGATACKKAQKFHHTEILLC